MENSTTGPGEFVDGVFVPTPIKIHENVYQNDITTHNGLGHTWGFLSSDPYTIDSVDLIEGRIEVVKRSVTTMTYTGTFITSTGTSTQPVRVWKEIYEAVDGEIKLVKTIEGREVPARPAYISFEKDDES